MTEIKSNKLGLFVNSLSLFVFTFITVRFVVYFNKLLLAKVFNIETIRIKFTLRGVSSADSGVWDYFSVLAFYSIELITLFLFIGVSYYLFNQNKKKSGIAKYIYFWYLVTSSIILFGVIVSGILTKTNVFHFFNWLHLPYAVSLILVLVVVFLTLFLGLRLNNYFLRFSLPMTQADSRSYFDFFPNYLLTAFLPVIGGLALLYWPSVSNMFKYDYIEVFVVLVFLLAGFTLRYDKTRRIRNDNLSKLNFPVIIVFLISYMSFLYIEVF